MHEPKPLYSLFPVFHRLQTGLRLHATVGNGNWVAVKCWTVSWGGRVWFRIIREREWKKLIS